MTGQPPEGRRLLRVLGVGFGVAVIIGTTIGGGILRTPGFVAERLPSPALILGVWALGGLYSLLDANCTTELATLLPQAGGPYVYVRAAFGDFPGFVLGWGDWVQNTVALGFLAVAFAEFAGVLVPALAGRAVGPVAALLLVALTAVQLAGVRAGSAVQRWSSAIKTLGFALLIGALFWAGRAAAGAHASAAGAAPAVGTSPPPAHVGGWALALGIVAAFRAVYTTYGGWNSAVYFAEEDTDPGRNLPRALLVGLLLVMAIYLLTNAALLHVLSPAQIAASPLPVAAAAQAAFGGESGRAVTVLAAVSLLSSLNATALQATRVLYGLGRDGFLPGIVTRVSSRGTPVPAALFTGGLAVALALTGSFDLLLALYALIGVLGAVLVNASLFTLRRRWPDRPRPFRARGYPGAVALVLAINALLALGFAVDDPTSGLYSVVALAVSYPLYRVARRPRPAAAAASPAP